MFEEFCATNIITLRERMSSFPLLSSLPDFTKKFDVVPIYLGPDHDGFAHSGDVLLVLKSYKVNKKSNPFAYKCLFEERIVYLINMLSDGIDPNVCFIKCN